jgi:hypothetical protein
MSTIEVFLWSAMTGAALLLTCAAAVASVRTPTLAAMRGLALISLISASAVLMSGLPEHLLEIADPRAWLPFKITLPPLSGALCLVYLGSWLGITAEERGAQRWVTLGSLCSWLGGLTVLAAFYAWPQLTLTQLVMASCAVNMVPVLIAIGLTARNMLQGDGLASWMLLACLSLAVMVLGMYAKGAGVQASVGEWAVVASSLLVYLSLAIGLTVTRFQHEKRLERMALGNTAIDPITGLSIGSVLISKMDDAMWRTARAGHDAAMVAIWIQNLYEHNESGGGDTVLEIRQRLTAAVRRAVGFKEVLGSCYPAQCA